ncbi:MAG: DUF4834 family protein [Bacteroidaceae bacterium]|nr:DUF4834 family protein [Bacteroidaceae bacterium]
MIITLIIILFIVLFVLLAVLTFARDVLVSIIAAIVGIFRKGEKSNINNTEGKQTVRRRDRARKKVLSDSDGEYVDFEEVKK